MKKEITAVFRLTQEEVREALYDFYVRKLRERHINTVFSPKDIEVDYTEVTLNISEVSNID